MIFMRYPSRAQLLYKVCTSSAHIPVFEKAIIHLKSKYPPTEMVHWLGFFFLATTLKTGHFAFFVTGIPSQIDFGNRSLHRFQRTIQTLIISASPFYITEINRVTK